MAEVADACIIEGRAPIRWFDQTLPTPPTQLTPRSLKRRAGFAPSPPESDETGEKASKLRNAQQRS